MEADEIVLRFDEPEAPEARKAVAGDEALDRVLNAGVAEDETSDSPPCESAQASVPCAWSGNARKSGRVVPSSGVSATIGCPESDMTSQPCAGLSVVSAVERTSQSDSGALRSAPPASMIRRWPKSDPVPSAGIALRRWREGFLSWKAELSSARTVRGTAEPPAGIAPGSRK